MKFFVAKPVLCNLQVQISFMYFFKKKKVLCNLLQSGLLRQYINIWLNNCIMLCLNSYRLCFKKEKDDCSIWLFCSLSFEGKIYLIRLGINHPTRMYQVLDLFSKFIIFTVLLKGKDFACVSSFLFW